MRLKLGIALVTTMMMNPLAIALKHTHCILTKAGWEAVKAGGVLTPAHIHEMAWGALVEKAKSHHFDYGCASSVEREKLSVKPGDHDYCFLKAEAWAVFKKTGVSPVPNDISDGSMTWVRETFKGHDYDDACKAAYETSAK
jgi:hypothetical protein